MDKLAAAAQARAEYLAYLADPYANPEDEEEERGPVPRPPEAGMWVPLDGNELGMVTLSFSIRAGPEGNKPQYSVVRQANGTVLEIHAQPCNVSRAAYGDSCAENLPVIQLDIEVPFSFIAIR